MSAKSNDQTVAVKATNAAIQPLKHLPISMSSISIILKNNLLYVDKTKYAYKMAEIPGSKIFLSRPRRFGKSMMLSTLEEMFRGNKELFKEQWIYHSPWDWQEYPIIRLDFNLATTTDLMFYIKDSLMIIAKKYDVFDQAEFETSTYENYFRHLILKLSAKFDHKQVVVLIDEYDKPILDVIDDVSAATAKRDILKGFYTVMKGLDDNLRFVFLTGVSRFSKVGVFSDLNNLDDISMSDAYADVCGVSQEELEHYCLDHIAILAKANGLSYENCLQKIKDWYNGFCFSENGVSVYNPYSTMNVLVKKKFGNFWFSSGNASFIIKLMKKQQNINMFKFDEYKTDVSTFDTFDVGNLNVIAMLFQSGYLTIKSYDHLLEKFILSYPNHEVSQSFKKNVLTIWCNQSHDINNVLSELSDALFDNEINIVMENIKNIFSNLDYDIVLSKESNYQSIFYLIFQLLGINIDVEYKTEIGRIDAIIQTKTHIFIFEFKLNKSAREALAQIKERRYLNRFIKLGKPIALIGANFNSELRNIDDYIVEQVQTAK